jgi:MIP family channel proteins
MRYARISDIHANLSALEADGEPRSELKSVAYDIERAARAIRESDLPNDWRRYAAEALGTFALVAVGPGAVMVGAATHAFGHTGVALAFGLVIAFVVAATGHLGGAHINPAVTVAFWSVRRFPTRDVLPYVVAQCIGAGAASFALRWILGPVGELGATVPTISLARAFAVECGYSALLAFVIMGVATDERSPAGVAPFAIGATVFAGALVTGPLTGGSFNPARSFGPALAGGGWSAHWLYWVAPIAGMVIAMHAYEALRGARPHNLPADVVTGVEGPIDVEQGSSTVRSAGEHRSTHEQ